jgi:tetratricopeptide (TPR) repeat protein
VNGQSSQPQVAAQVSGQEEDNNPSSSDSMEDPPSGEAVPESIAGEVESLKESIAAAADSAERIDLQQELVRLYADADRQDLAADVQEKIAAARQTAMAWADAGNLYYDWMMDRQSRAQQTTYARKAIQAYQRSLELDPTDLDVRTDMAVAYLYDPDNPMEAIKQTKKVLAQDPDHLQANFNRGIMLLRINRVDEAIQQFQKVKQLAGPNSPVYERTEQVLQQIRQQQ